MQGEHNIDSLYPLDSQPGLWRNLSDYVMSNIKMQGYTALHTSKARISASFVRKKGYSPVCLPEDGQW